MKLFVWIWVLYTVPPILWAKSEKEVCQFTQKYFKQFTSVCRNDYLLFCENGKNKCPMGRTGEKVKVGGFNILNLGIEEDFRKYRQTLFKDLKLMAEVMRPYDVVATVELKHLGKYEWEFNQEVDRLLRAGTVEFSVQGHEKVYSRRQIKSHLYLPPYLELLRELNKLDKDNNPWVLILSPHLHSDQPEDTLNNELTGFYVNTSKVKITKNSYCDSLACALSSDSFPIPIRRAPFIASFQGGHHPFHLIAWHTRFERPKKKNEKGKDVTDMAMLKTLTDYYKATGVSEKGILNQEILARFSETKAVFEVLESAVQNVVKGPLLVYSDFNLPAVKIGKRNYPKMWKDLLSELKTPSRLHVTNPTTLGKTGLVNNYDHFVEMGSFCHPFSAKVFNFTRSEVFPSLPDQLNRLKFSRLKQKLSKMLALKKGKIAVRYSEKQLNYYEQGYQMRVREPFEKNELTWIKELISDHLPISLTCHL